MDVFAIGVLAIHYVLPRDVDHDLVRHVIRLYKTLFGPTGNVSLNILILMNVNVSHAHFSYRLKINIDRLFIHARIYKDGASAKF